MEDVTNRTITIVCLHRKTVDFELDRISIILDGFSSTKTS